MGEGDGWGCRPAAVPVRELGTGAPRGLGPCFSKCRPGIRRTSATWEPVRPVLRPHPRATESEALGEGLAICFNKPSG